jgi:predicted transcriptional regulator
MIALVTLSGMHGAEGKPSEPLIVVPDDQGGTGVFLNISSPVNQSSLVNITEKIDGKVAEKIDEKVDEIEDNIPVIRYPEGNKVPANISFRKENEGIGGISRGTSSGIRSSPGMLSDGIGMGLARIDDTVPEEAQENGKVCSSIVFSLVGEGTGRFISKLPAQQPAEPGDVRVSSNQFVATTMVGIIIMAFASVFSFRSSGQKTLPLLVPLYSRISREEVLENETRGNIYRLISGSPGLDLLSIKNALGLSNGVIAHHIHTLEREKYLRSVRDGRYRRFFVNGTKVELTNSVELAILREIEGSPAINQSQIAKNLGISRQALNYHIRKLVKNGSIVTEKSGRETLCRRRDS